MLLFEWSTVVIETFVPWHRLQICLVAELCLIWSILFRVVAWNIFIMRMLIVKVTHSLARSTQGPFPDTFACQLKLTVLDGVPLVSLFSRLYYRLEWWLSWMCSQIVILDWMSFFELLHVLMRLYWLRRWIRERLCSLVLVVLLLLYLLIVDWWKEVRVLNLSMLVVMTNWRWSLVLRWLALLNLKFII